MSESGTRESRDVRCPRCGRKIAVAYRDRVEVEHGSPTQRLRLVINRGEIRETKCPRCDFDLGAM